MNKILKPILLAAVMTILGACNSSDDEDCMKTIVVQPEFEMQTPYGYISYPEITQEVTCDTPEPEFNELDYNPEPAENFTYEIIYFNYVPDTGENTSRLQFQVALQNNNDHPIYGIPVFTLKIDDDTETTSSFTTDDAPQCREIEANSECIFSYDMDESLDYGQLDSLELVHVEYLVINFN